MIIVGKWSPAIANTYLDPYGRFVSVTLNVPKSPNLTVYSAYNVCENKITTAGKKTIYAQQWKLLRLQGVNNPDPRHQLIKDLAKQVQHDTKSRKQHNNIR